MIKLKTESIQPILVSFYEFQTLPLGTIGKIKTEDVMYNDKLVVLIHDDTITDKRIQALDGDCAAFWLNVSRDCHHKVELCPPGTELVFQVS